MVVGFLKGIWGKEAQPATGMVGIWGTITSVPSKIIGAITTPAKIIKVFLMVGIGFLLYKRFKK